MSIYIWFVFIRFTIIWVRLRLAPLRRVNDD